MAAELGDLATVQSAIQVNIYRSYDISHMGIAPGHYPLEGDKSSQTPISYIIRIFKFNIRKRNDLEGRYVQGKRFLKVHVQHAIKKSRHLFATDRAICNLHFPDLQCKIHFPLNYFVNTNHLYLIISFLVCFKAYTWH